MTFLLEVLEQHNHSVVFLIDAENVILYLFPIFVFTLWSVLFCCGQLSALKRAKLHVLVRTSATNFESLFTSSSPWTFLSMEILPALSFKSVCVSVGPSPEDHRPVFRDLGFRNYIRVANIWQAMKDKIKCCSCPMFNRVLDHLNWYCGAANDSCSQLDSCDSQNSVTMQRP